MDTTANVEIVIHPVRLRILLALQAGPQTTQELADQLADVPKSSLYRHLKLLLESAFITVAETRLVQGIQEKVYQLNRPARLSAKDVAHLSADDHLRYFTTYLMVLLRGFDAYLSTSPEPDFVEDRTGYSEVSFWADKTEVDAFSTAINEAIVPLLQNKRGGERRRRKLAIITYPEEMRNAK